MRCAGLLVATVIVGAVLTVTSVSKADTQIGLDLDFVTSTDRLTADTGVGGSVRLGQELDAVLVTFTPEIGGSYYNFNEPSIYRGFVGGRLGFFKVIEPSLFGHVGLGHASFDDRFFTVDQSRTAVTFDGGLAIDFTLAPLVDLGVHGAYNWLGADGDLQDSIWWVNLGAHAELVF